MEASIVERFIEKITSGKKTHVERFYEIFSARGFLLELDNKFGNVRLSDDSHPDDGEFLEMLQHINYKKICKKPHQDSINEHSNEDNVCDGAFSLIMLTHNAMISRTISI